MAGATYLCGPTASEYTCPRCGAPLLVEMLGMLACSSDDCGWDEATLRGGYCSPRGCNHDDCNEAEGCLHEHKPQPHLADRISDAPPE